MDTKEKKKKTGHSSFSQEEWDVRYDIIYNSLWIILKYLLLLSVIWYVIFLFIEQQNWYICLIKAVFAPGVLVVLTNLFVFFYERYHLPLNDGVILLILDIVVVLVLAADTWTHSLMMFSVLPLIFCLFLKYERLIYLQAVISLILMISHYLLVETDTKQELKASVLFHTSGILFDVFVFANMIFQIRKYTQMLDTQSTIDSLTRLHNHECFYEELDARIMEHQRNGQSLSILIADIDNFKKVNDTFGHAYGDKVLKALADIFTREAGKRCFVARYGGEEFAMIMNLNQSDALAKAQIIRKNFEHTKIATVSGQENSFTVSIGVAVYIPEYKTSSHFFDKADEALYRAKASGKNRVCLNKE